MAVRGDRVFTARKLAGLTQLELAERAQLSVDVISRIERGTYQADLRLTSLVRLARHLGVPFAELIELPEGDIVREVDANRIQGLRRVLRPAQLDNVVVVQDVPDWSYTALRPLVVDVTKSFNAAMYDRVVADMPEVWAVVKHGLTLARDDEKPKFYKLLVHIYMVIAETLVWLRAEDLAWAAITEAVSAAERAGDSVASALAMGEYVWIYTRQAMFQEAQTTAAGIAEQLRVDMRTSSTREWAVWGQLMRQGSRAAALAGNTTDAQEMLRLAHSAAVRIETAPLDYDDYFGAFGTARIGITRAELALIEGDFRRATQIGESVSRAPYLHLDMWLHHLMVQIRANLGAKRYRLAVSGVRTIHELAPEWLRESRTGHDAVRELAGEFSVAQVRSTGLVDIAKFMGVLP